MKKLKSFKKLHNVIRWEKPPDWASVDPERETGSTWISRFLLFNRGLMRCKSEPLFTFVSLALEANGEETVEVTDEFVDKFGFDDADLLNKQLRDLVKLGFLYPITLSYETPRKYKFTERWMPHRFDFGDKKVIALCDNKYEECVAG